MNKKFKKTAAKLYYKEHVEGEPLTQDTPIECFVEGANFILRAQKIHENKCNISNYIPYNLKNQNMDNNNVAKKIVELKENNDNIITGFYITAHGDPSVGIPQCTWELRNDFYFDDKNDLDNFKEELQKLFEFYCSENVEVLTFEEHQRRCELEEVEYYQQYPVRFLIKDRGNYKQAGSTAVYGSSAADGIHVEIPKWISEDSKLIIKSTEPKFREILLEEARDLENEMKNSKNRLRDAQRRLRLIEQELKYGN